MKLPHWLRHHWSEWKSDDLPSGRFFGPMKIDTRSCTRCGRRQERRL